jgi:hypothetical protein
MFFPIILHYNELNINNFTIHVGLNKSRHAVQTGFSGKSPFYAGEPYTIIYKYKEKGRLHYNNPFNLYQKCHLSLCFP